MKDPDTDRGGTNEVTLLGRLSAPPQQRVMPSEDELVSFRLVVPRAPARRRVGERKAPTVDVIDIACWSARTRRTALALEVDDTVQVRGALRRRFWKAGGVTTSRHEVEAAQVTRVRVPAPSSSQ